VRYLIAKDNISQEELVERIKYIYEIFHIYTIKDNVQSTDKIIILNSIPKNQLDLFIIVGHDKRTDEYIIKHYKEIIEKKVIILACNTLKFLSLKFLKNKDIYIPQNTGIINVYNGEKYGFKFDVTDEEILLYRYRNEKIENTLNQIFRRKN
jgi:hypothetical protein